MSHLETYTQHDVQRIDHLRQKIYMFLRFLEDIDILLVGQFCGCHHDHGVDPTRTYTVVNNQTNAKLHVAYLNKQLPSPVMVFVHNPRLLSCKSKFSGSPEKFFCNMESAKIKLF